MAAGRVALVLGAACVDISWGLHRADDLATEDEIENGERRKGWRWEFPSLPSLPNPFGKSAEEKQKDAEKQKAAAKALEERTRLEEKNQASSKGEAFEAKFPPGYGIYKKESGGGRCEVKDENKEFCTGGGDMPLELCETQGCCYTPSEGRTSRVPQCYRATEPKDGSPRVLVPLIPSDKDEYQEMKSDGAAGMPAKCVTFNCGAFNLTCNKYEQKEHSRKIECSSFECTEDDFNTCCQLIPTPAPTPVPVPMCQSWKGAHGKYLSAQPDGKAVADRGAVGAWEKFSPEKQSDGLISYKSHHGKYLSAQSNGNLDADRGSIGAWEKFTLESHSDGKFSLKGAHGKYVVAESDGRANANRAAVGSWEKWEVADLPCG